MLRKIMSQVTGGGRRGTSTGTPGTTRGGGANRELEQGAKSLFRGLSRKRRGRP